MNKVNKKGFFLVETIVVIAIVGIVLTFLFKTFSTVYTRFSESQYYNTVAAINASGNIKQYMDKLNINYSDLLNSNSYLDITGSNVLLNDYYSLLKSKLNIQNVYLINIKTFFQNTNNLNSFNVGMKTYLNTLKNDTSEYKIVVVTSTGEYGSIAAFNYTLALTGNANDEYGVYVAVGDSYVEPGYQAVDKDGNNLDVLITGVVDTNTPGTYYLNYNVGSLGIRRKVVVYKKIYTYDYTGNYQIFTAPVNGKYEIELWGSGVPSGNGNGAYTKGDTYLFAGQTLYVYVGQSTNTANSESFNGGISSSGGFPGGGATDARLISGNWKGIESLRSRIMVASGAGAGNIAGSHGGALTGIAAGVATGGTQTSPGTNQSATYYLPSFGIGGGGCGGGGGYYGGGGASCASGGAGGSSFISGYSGCDAVTKDGAQTAQSVHYSGFRFINTLMTAGNASMPNPRGAGNITGNPGNGYARITLLGTNASNTLQHVRYIYNSINGSTASASNHWVELQAYDLSGNNIAIGNTSITSSYFNGDTYYWGPLTDGVITTTPYISGNSGSTAWVRLDLGAEYDLSSIRLWHYYGDGRTYYEEQIKVAGNDLIYTTVQQDNYKETSDGFIVRPVPTS